MVLLLLIGFARAVYCKGLESSDAAGWMQAIGALAAIAGAFRIMQIQNTSERLRETERRAREGRAIEDEELAARLLAVRNTVQVATHALYVMRNSVDNARYPARTYVTDRYGARMGPVSKILDGFITPKSQHIAVIAALNISLAIAAVQENLARTGGSLTEELFGKCEEKIAEAELMLADLIELQGQLLIEQNQRQTVS